jgi:hypothetical protein
MKKLLLICMVAAVLGFSSFAHAELIDRGGGLIYDKDLDITWYDAPAVWRNWNDSITWAANLTKGGVTGWRLPNTVEGPYVWGYDGKTTAGMNIITSEMGHLFYAELGNKGLYDVNGQLQYDGTRPNDIMLLNKGPFVNLNGGYHWSGTEHEYAPGKYQAWNFYFYYGMQERDGKSAGGYALAVHPGDIGAPVPIPGAIWLLGSGLFGLIGLKRKLLHQHICT